jgi:LysR family glycine cleavage system transcriptional activator
VDWAGLSSETKEWSACAKAEGVEGIDVERGPRFTVENMAIEAAINGGGVALVSYYSVIEELNTGRLVKPFDTKVESELAYWLVCPHSHLRREKVKSFCDWLSNGAARYGSITRPVLSDQI